MDDTPVIDEKDLTDIPSFEQFYLIGKILGESMSLKYILSKCVSDWHLTDEVSIADMGNGFSVVKFTMLEKQYS